MFVQETTKIPGYNLHEHPIIPLRDTLFAFVPKSNASGEYEIEILDADHNIRYQTALVPPNKIPPADEPFLPGKPRVEFSTKAYTTVIPWKALGFPLQGLNVEITDKKTGAVGTIGAAALVFSVPAHIVMHNIRIGELTAPPNKTAQALDFERTANYLQTIPAAMLTVDNYAPLQLSEIVDQAGQKYTDTLPGKGDAYGGKGEHFAREVIARAILIANNGYLLWHEVKNWEPSLTRINMLVKGKYENGIVQHGYHATWIRTFIFNTDGNEYSHEVGHTFGLADYEGGKLGGHKHMDGWAFDAYNDMFLSVLDWSASPSEVLGEKPFKNIFSYGKDAMSGGTNNGSVISNYTLYTPNSLKIIAKTFQNSLYFQKNKQGQYRLYGFDPVTEKMVDKTPSDAKLPINVGIPVVTIAGYYDPSKKIFPKGAYILPAMFSHYGNVFNYSTPQANDCSLNIKMENGDVQKVALPNTNFYQSDGNLFAINIPQINQPKSISVFCPGSSQPLFTREVAYPTTKSTVVTVGGSKGYTEVANNTAGLTYHVDKQVFEPNVAINFNYLLAKDLTKSNIGLIGPSGDNIAFTLQPTTSSLTYRLLLSADAVSGVYTINIHDVVDNHGNTIKNKSATFKYDAIPQIVFTKAATPVTVDLSALENYINSPGSGQRLAYTIDKSSQEMLAGPDTYNWDSTTQTFKTTTLIKVLDAQNDPISFKVWNGQYLMNSFANWYISQDKMSLEIDNITTLPKGVLKGQLFFIARWWNNSIDYPFAVRYVIDND